MIDYNTQKTCNKERQIYIFIPHRHPKKFQKEKCCITNVNLALQNCNSQQKWWLGMVFSIKNCN